MSTTEAAPVEESADEPHFTVREVAEKLKLSRKYIYRAIDTGELECHRYGRAIRLTRSQVRAFIVKHRKKQ